MITNGSQLLVRKMWRVTLRSAAVGLFPSQLSFFYVQEAVPQGFFFFFFWYNRQHSTLLGLFWRSSVAHTRKGRRSQ